VDLAQQDLARATAAETDASALVRLAETIIGDEQEAACALDASDGAVEAFARWLPGARQRAHSARSMLESTQAEVGRMRALLTAARQALETVEALSEHRQTEREADVARRTQREMEDSCRVRDRPNEAWP